LLEQSRAKLEFLHHEQGSSGHRSEETQRTAVAEARLTEAQKRMAALHNKMMDLHIRYDEAVTNAKELGEKLAALIEHAHKDQEEA
jgi:phage terminase Nu1 subunit (DNA packaging protein)